MLLLASASPRRRALLTLTGLSFSTARPDIDETPRPAEPADHYVARLSREKSDAIATADGLILTADTTVADGSAILGKPLDAADATAILRQLRGRAHTVYTGLTVRDPAADARETRVVATTVTMRAYTDAEIAQYVASGDSFDKAGAYAIQNADFNPVARLNGCYANVMGLPLCAVCQMLAARGVSIPTLPVCDLAHNQCAIGPLT